MTTATAPSTLPYKVKNMSLADFGRNVLLRHSFNQTQEAEADSYAFEFLKQSRYNPRAQALAFERLRAAQGGKDAGSAQILRDYFRSHPPLESRIAKYSEKARHWWSANAGKRYVGRENLHFLIPLSEQDLGAGEWITHY